MSMHEPLFVSKYELDKKLKKALWEKLKREEKKIKMQKAIATEV